jgi:ADP-ribosyl-[dinitrogen reductase] hydrolase
MTCIRERAQGAMVALGTGDAMGAPVELWTRAQIAQRYGQLDELTGQTTDDTAQMFALAEAIDPHYDDQAAIANYVHWYEVNGQGIGSNSRHVLGAAAAGLDSRAAAEEFLALQPERPPSNGALMRCVPLAIRYYHDLERMLDAAEADATLTHAHPLCSASVSWYLNVMAALLQGESLAVAFEQARVATPTAAQDEVERVVAMTEIEEIEEWAENGRGMTLIPVVMTSWALRQAMSVEEGMVWAVNCGGDTDTNAAVVGAMLAARDGFDAIPERWHDGLWERDRLLDEADRLLDLAIAEKA